MKKTLKYILILSVLGVFVAGYSLYDHFQPMDGSGLCNISETINCDIVNKGPYSEILGFFPVALLGVLFYLFLVVFTLFTSYKKTDNDLLFGGFLSVISGLGVLYSLSLGVFVYYKLGAICPVCVTSYIIVILIFLLSLKNLRSIKNK